MAKMRRIFVALEKGKCCFPIERFSEILGIAGQAKQLADELAGLCFGILHYPKPEPFVFLKQSFPLIQHGGRDFIAAAELFHRLYTQKMRSQHPQNEWQAVCSIGDDVIRQDGVCVPAAAAPHPLNLYAAILHLAAFPPYEAAPVAAVRSAIPT